ncbi:CCA tRNA nucleotidyltransferase [Sphingomonas immobilis]|uniref:CCA tRNA nucleotidyltransferase n=1 Tax=Sphingomonas immobilis TaxID=3063997 RepID=A0ABT9A075_9SPHN|nr:CCA tRNA nucleotidyltransferase [Sphingomonas sp. CA1-15]MDO7842928.1 CCA tRNA nucleotidyltransferase [Sphingomonas sp. CA1-15]
MERLKLPERVGMAGLYAALDADAGHVRLVGGAVRDTVLGIPVADIDLATDLAPEDVLKRLRAAGIKAVPTGLAHGTITAVLPEGPIEVTTLRRDVATDGRHATVAFTGDWREDAARRDFTINALYADPLTGEMFDYFGGRDDLAARRVRFIGDPLQRIAEDYLRILRFFRFHARFGAVVDAEGLAACAARANDLMALSRERIAAELLKLVVAPGAVPTLALMIDQGIFLPVLPEIADAARIATLAEREAEASIAPAPIRRLAALLPPDPAIADDVGARLKLSKNDRRRLVSAATPASAEPSQTLAYALGTDLAIDRLLLSDRPVADAEAIVGWQAPRLPLGGGALVERGVKKGPEVAKLLREIESAWVAEGFPAEPRVTQLADAAVDQWRRFSSNA